MTFLLQAHGLAKQFSFPKKVTLFTNISLTIEPQTSLAITGASGCGKTTLLHILAGLEKATSGKVILGPSFHQFFLERSLIFQSYNLLEDFTVLQNTLMPARIARKCVEKDSPLYQRALTLLEKVGLQERLFFPVKLLSGGERQRCAIARALILKPQILFADEPTGNLDPECAEKIGSLLLSMVKEQNTSLVLVTHYEPFAQAVDRVFCLEKGQLFAQQENKAVLH